MLRPRPAAPALLTAAVLALAGCAGTADGPEDGVVASAREVVVEADGGGATEDAIEDASEDARAGDDSGDGALDGDLPVSDTDPDGGAGPDDDQVSYPASDSILAPECAEVPAPPIAHEIVSMDVTEVDGGFECVTEVDARGDSAFLADEIAAQLDAAGHEQTSRPPSDDSVDAVNTMSYLVGTGELHVTVRQNGASGVIIHYALVPLRGNG